jgi:hypothetical protein
MAILQFPKKEPHMVKAMLKRILLVNGHKASSLNDLVHSAASQEATNANNGGIDEQLNFLLNTCGWHPQNIINELEIQA